MFMDVLGYQFEFSEKEKIIDSSFVVVVVIVVEFVHGVVGDSDFRYGVLKSILSCREDRTMVRMATNPELNE